MVEKGIRGEICHTIHTFVKASKSKKCHWFTW